MNRTMQICVWIGLAVALTGCTDSTPMMRSPQSCAGPTCQRRIDLTQINMPTKRIYRAQVASSPSPDVLSAPGF